jgi:1-acyl-sn-glycerol-3-phosphate acyltransferase
MSNSGHSNSGHVRRRWRLGFWFRLAAFVLWPFLMVFTKRDWKGQGNLEQDGGGIIVAANHLSWFDPLALSNLLWNNDRPPRFLAKEPMFRVPIIGRIVRGAGQIPVYRESAEAVDAVRDAISAVQKGECVVVYPEGTMTKDPDMWMMALKTGAARIALATQRPLIPVAQWGPEQVMRPYVKQLRLFPRKTMVMRVGPPVDLSDLYDMPLDADTLHIASQRIWEAITDLLAQARGEVAPTKPFQADRSPS